MNGARWGWLALIGAIAVLFAASSQESASHGKQLLPLRQDLKRVTRERDEVIAQRDEARELAGETQEWATLLQGTLETTEQEVRQLRAEREALRNEIAKLSLDRGQLQQTIAGLQQERAQTKRNVEQLRHGLHQLLSQTETVATNLAQPAPGPATAAFVEEVKAPALMPLPVPAEIIYEDMPLNKNQ